MRKYNRKMRGGTEQSFLTPQPVVATPLKYGASNPGQEAFLEQQNNAINQQRINDGLPPLQTGGNGEIIVPQVDNPLPSQPNDANAMSAQLNEILAQQQANAIMDGCVGQGAGCTNTNYWDGKGGKRKTKKSRKVNKKKSQKIKKTRKNKKSRKSRKSKK